MKPTSLSIDELISGSQTDALKAFAELLNCKERDRQLFTLFETRDATFDPNLRWLSVQVAPIEEKKQTRAVSLTEQDVREYFGRLAPVSKVRALSQTEFLVEVESPVQAHLLKLAFDGLVVKKLQVRFELESACDFEAKVGGEAVSREQSGLKFPSVTSAAPTPKLAPSALETAATEKKNGQGRKLSHQSCIQSFGLAASDSSKPARRTVKWSEDSEGDSLPLSPKPFETVKAESEKASLGSQPNGFSGIKFDDEELLAGQSLLQNKFTCRYDIAIEHSQSFPIAKKIIGSNGCNMKDILEKSRIHCGGTEEEGDAVKLRLRGRGSGFKEGHDRRESDDALHLCVSAKNELAFEAACLHVEKLLQKIFDEYLSHLRRKGNVKVLSNDKGFLDSLKFTKRASAH